MPVRNSTNINDFQQQSVPLDYPGAGVINWTQSTPATDAHASTLTQAASSLSPHSTGSSSNFQWGSNPTYGQLNQGLQGMFQGQQSLLKGPQDAFSPSERDNLHAMAVGQLQTANRQATAGVAGANASRGVAGNNVGGLLSQQLGVQQAGALAQGDLAERLQGRQQGLSEYNARSGVAGTLGNLVNSEDQRRSAAQDAQFKSYNDEKNNAFSEYTQAQQNYNDLMRQYLIQSTTTSGSKNGDQTKMYLRAKLVDANRERLIKLKQYQQYGASSNPNAQQTQFAPYAGQQGGGDAGNVQPMPGALGGGDSGANPFGQQFQQAA